MTNCQCNYSTKHECYCTGEECFNYQDCECPCHIPLEQWNHIEVKRKVGVEA